MNFVLALIIVVTFTYLLIWAMSPRLARRLDRWLKRNIIDRLSDSRKRYKNMKKHSTPSDTFKWCMSFAGLFVLIVFVAGLFSHFQYLNNAKYACNQAMVILGSEGCSYDYNYFIPDGLKPFEVFDPSKLGIEMKCLCGDVENHIKINENFRRWLE